MKFDQYDVVIVNLNPSIGKEINKIRPCIILSPKEMNYHNVIIAPLTSQYKKYPTRIILEQDSYIVLDQIRTISIKRIISKKDFKIDADKIQVIKNILKEMLID